MKFYAQDYLVSIKKEIFLVEFANFIRYTRELKFEQKPDYEYLITMFKNLFKEKGYKDNSAFDWENILFIENKRTKLRDSELHIEDSDYTGEDETSFKPSFEQEKRKQNLGRQETIQAEFSTGLQRKFTWMADIADIPCERDFIDKTRTVPNSENFIHHSKKRIDTSSKLFLPKVSL